MIEIKDLFKKLEKLENLNSSESDFLVDSIFKKKIEDSAIGSILTFLKLKSESFEEIFSFQNYLKKKCKKFNFGNQIMDTCGTGGDNKQSFNFSTAVAILLSACDVKIVKHGNRSITSKSGSFDVLESLGVDINLKPEKIEKFFQKHGICFLFAPNFHSTLKEVAPIRKNLPFKTIFNLLGPLLNPCKLTYQILGVSNKKNLFTHAKCLREINIKKAWVVHNHDGYDEMTTTSSNSIIEISKNKVSKEIIINPNELGFETRNQNELNGGSSHENAFLMKRLFDGETGAIRDNVLLNAGAALLISEKVTSLKNGIELAKKNIDNGKASKKLEEITKK
tara:strand:+ start:419 stop:1426 length:1008 start_codon:yes stop_codon:yes gene_type:complete